MRRFALFSTLALALLCSALTTPAKAMDPATAAIIGLASGVGRAVMQQTRPHHGHRHHAHYAGGMRCYVVYDYYGNRRRRCHVPTYMGHIYEPRVYRPAPMYYPQPHYQPRFYRPAPHYGRHYYTGPSHYSGRRY